MTSIVPISQIRSRPPEHGRIRFGERTTTRGGKEIPRAINRFRFTSPDREAIEQLAALYGGQCTPWTDPKASPQHQFEVTTTSSRIQVLLPVDCYSVAYEQWGGKGIERRCDGEVCSFYGMGRPMVRPCICAEQTVQSCKPYSRVNVILPNVNLGGVWRLEVKGRHFMHEAPGMIDVIQQMYPGMARVELLLTERTSRGTDDRGKPITHHFIVPQFVVAMTPDQMLAGLGQVQALPPVQRAIGPSLDDEVVDGEIMDDEDLWHTPVDESDPVLVELLERSVEQVQVRQSGLRAVPEGWSDEDRPPNIKVRRNPDPDGPKWIRR